MKLNTNSNVYTIVYAAVVVVVVAFLLATVSSVLKSRSDANVRIDTKKQILASLNIRGVANEDVEARYDQVIKEELLVDTSGKILADKGGFDIPRKEIKAEFNKLPVFKAQVEGAQKYVIPLVGKGLWGGIWGYLSLNDDAKTVYGAYFSHESETAGLGALITEEKFQDQFKGKSIYDTAGEIALSVVKHGTASQDDINKCDGISGATLTGNGVDAMLKDYLKLYGKYLSSIHSQQVDSVKK